MTLKRAGGSGEPIKLGDGGFQECNGLEISVDLKDLNEGGYNNRVRQLLGRGKYSSITLRRGMLYPAGGKVKSELWAWLQSVLGGERPVRRYDGKIEVRDAASAMTVATWLFDRGLPQKIAGPQLNAKTGEIAIEELTIAHEGLRLEL